MPDSPLVLVFDVNETLSDMDGLGAAFAESGLEPDVVATWFAGVLRDGFALMITGATTSFADVAAAGLRTVFERASAADGEPADVDAAVERVLAAFTCLDVHPDVEPGVLRLGQQGRRLVTLSNGAGQVAQALLERAELVDSFERVLSVEDAGVWKPHPRAYAYAAETLGLETGELMLVAVHPWDIDGAARAGLRTAWVNRGGSTYPDVFAAPELQARDLVELAELLDADLSS